MKRVLLFYLIMVLLITSLAGCGGKKAEDQKPAAGRPDIKREEAKPARAESTADIIAKSKKIEGMSYEYIMSGLSAGQQTGKVWMSGKKIKTERTQGGQRIITIIDADTNTVYSYYPAQNKAVKIISGELGPDAQTPTDYTRSTDPKAIKVIKKRTVYDGVVCQIWQLQEQDGSETKMWVREDYGLPVRVEVKAPGGLNMVMEYKNMKIGPLPAETFKLPPGVQVTDLTGVMKGLPQAPRTK
ncbi:MAG: hypothetical protein AB1426_00600 [Bacillota bacterium]